MKGIFTVLWIVFAYCVMMTNRYLTTEKLMYSFN